MTFKRISPPKKHTYSFPVLTLTGTGSFNFSTKAIDAFIGDKKYIKIYRDKNKLGFQFTSNCHDFDYTLNRRVRQIGFSSKNLQNKLDISIINSKTFKILKEKDMYVIDLDDHINDQ